MAHIEQDNNSEQEDSEEIHLQDLLNEIQGGAEEENEDEGENEDDDEYMMNLPEFNQEMLDFEIFLKNEEIIKIETMHLKQFVIPHLIIITYTFYLKFKEYHEYYL